MAERKCECAIPGCLCRVHDVPHRPAPVPDPRFRDQLAEALDNHELSSGGRGGVLCRCGWAGWGQDYPAHRAGAIAAEVEARVQAGVNQRAAEELRAAVLGLAEELDGHERPGDWEYGPTINCHFVADRIRRLVTDTTGDAARATALDPS